MQESINVSSFFCHDMMRPIASGKLPITYSVFPTSNLSQCICSEKHGCLPQTGV